MGRGKKRTNRSLTALENSDVSHFELLIYAADPAKPVFSRDELAQAVVAADEIAQQQGCRVQVMRFYHGNTCTPVYDTAFPDRRPFVAVRFVPRPRSRPSELAERASLAT